LTHSKFLEGVMREGRIMEGLFPTTQQ
jgi:hypothetical protein